MAENNEQIVYVVTHCDDDPEKATIPFILANGALAMDLTPVIVLQSKAVMLAVKGYAKHIHSAHMDPVEKLIDNYISMGHKLLVCGPCIKKRNIEESELIEGALVVGAGKLTEVIMESKNVLTY